MLTPEESLLMKKEYEDFKKDVKSTLASMKSTIALMKKNNEELKTKINKNLNKTFEVCHGTEKAVHKHGAFLESTKECFENCEDTFLNVLAAIRQNEYLQAYYPEQKGYPEMKVVGVHPSKIKKKEKVS